MFFQRGLHGRVTKLETDVAAIGTDVKDVQAGQFALGGKIDKLVEGLTSTDGRAAERAHAVKSELREEAEKKGRERSELFKNGLALIGGVTVIVGALVGPYIGQLNTTTSGQRADTVAVAAVREVLAQQGAGIGRDQAAIDIIRENNRIRDAELREHDQDIAFAKGVAAARAVPTFQ